MTLGDISLLIDNSIINWTLKRRSLSFMKLRGTVIFILLKKKKTYLGGVDRMRVIF